MTRCVALLAALTVALAIATAPAFAQTSGSGYSSPAGEIQADVSNPNDTTPASNTNNGAPASATATKAASGGSLPFTGLDVGFLLGAGVALLLVGGTLSRLTRSTSSRTE
jgi:hypothetical protein